MLKKGRSRKRGAILVDALLGAYVLGLLAVALCALSATIHKSQVMSRDEAKALTMSTRFVEQLQLLKASDLNARTLTQLNLIDRGQSAPPFTFTRIPLDDASGYSPRQALKNGRGTLDLIPVDAGSVRAEVLIQWTSPSGVERAYRTGTIIGGYQ